MVSSTQSYKFVEDYGPSVQLKHTQEAFESDMRSVAPADAGVSRSSVCTIHLSNPNQHGSLEDAIMEALGAAINESKKDQ